MAQENLRITITADNRQALEAMKATITSLDGVSSAAGATGGKVVKMGKDFTGVSRVIQDLPYGFNAIANNLTNILPAAGGVGLAVSGAVAAFQIFSMGIDNFMARFWGFRKSVTDAKKETEDFTTILGKEKTQLDLLFATATNANIPLNARLNSVKELRNNYGAYLQNFSDEEIIAGKAGEAYKKLSAAIIMSAKARAATNTLTELQTQLLQEEQGAMDDLAEAQNKAASAAAWRGQAQAAQISGLGYAKDELQTTRLQNDASNELLNNLTERGAKIAEIQKKMAFLTSTIEQNTVQLTNNNEEIKKGNVELDKNIKLRQSLHGKMLEESMRLDALSLVAPEDKAAAAFKPPDPSKLGELEYLRNKKTYQDDYNKTLEVANNLTNLAMNNITGMVNAMQQGQSIGEAFGNMFKNLAIQIGLAAAKAAIFQGILALLPGGTTGAALAKKTGTEAGGGGFFKIFKSLLGFSEGGTVSGPKSGYPVMLHGTEHIVRPDQMRSIIASAAQMGGGNSRVIVEGRISGQDIWLSQHRTNTFRALTT